MIFNIGGSGDRKEFPGEMIEMPNLTSDTKAKIFKLLFIYVGVEGGGENIFNFVSDYSFFPSAGEKVRQQQVTPAGVFPLGVPCCVLCRILLRN